MYSAYDSRHDGYLVAGRNSSSKEECVQKTVDWLTTDWDFSLKERSFFGTTEEKSDQLKLYDIEIEEHDELVEGQWIKALRS